MYLPLENITSFSSLSRKSSSSRVKNVTTLCVTGFLLIVSSLLQELPRKKQLTRFLRGLTSIFYLPCPPTLCGGRAPLETSCFYTHTAVSDGAWLVGY